mmetsp:Transcript_6988/g.12666  ORF Transcript_6988/g.12666 Transcript_6988/m.12666 type:complete len:103 (+) Transcript_6988:322-630(+)
MLNVAPVSLVTCDSFIVAPVSESGYPNNRYVSHDHETTLLDTLHLLCTGGKFSHDSNGRSSALKAAFLTQLAQTIMCLQSMLEDQRRDFSTLSIKPDDSNTS